MTTAAGTEPVAAPARGEVRFIARDALARMRGAVEAAGWVLAAAAPAGPAARGLLDKLVEESIDEVLERRGAAAPGVVAASDRSAVLNDQIYRAQRAGARGIALALGTLAGLAGPDGALDPEDSAALRALACASRDRPFSLWLDEADAALLGYPAPLALHDLLAGANGTSAATARISRGSDDEAGAEAAAGTARSGSQATNAGSGRGVPAWRALVRDLEEAQGPKPLPVVERLFVERYVPLAHAVANGEADGRAAQALARFSKSFEKSYREAFAALTVTRKRPPMVLDAPQICARVARLHGARSVAMLLVDAMRFDLGGRVATALGERLAPHAVCAEQMLLWAALPTTTSNQLRLLARGPQGLGEAPDGPESERDMVAPRGRASLVPRRMRVGGRDLYKLDVVQASLAEAGPREPERLDALAELVAGPAARLARELAPRTLLFVFGDHGFELGRKDGGTGPAREGGASPEHVLVPAQAWLLGDVQ
jgi:hypothetical protein